MKCFDHPEMDAVATCPKCGWLEISYISAIVRTSLYFRDILVWGIKQSLPKEKLTS